MSWDAKDPFSTRHGPAIGKSSESRMLSAMGGANTIKKRFQTNMGGSVTMAHTRGPGTSPEFITTGLPPVVSLPYCAAIPVCNEAVYGFVKGGVAITAFTETEETQPASALITISDAAQFSVAWNKRKTKSAATTNDLHPGNRIWYDSRDPGVRTFKGVVSWWCPVNHLQTQAISHAGSSDNNRVWLGEQCVTTPSSVDGSQGVFMESMKGVVFVDGVKVHTFAGYVLTAAKDTAANKLYAVTVDSLFRRYVPDWFAGLGMTGIKLVTYDLTSASESEVVLSPDPWLTNNIVAAPPPLPQFSPNATKLLFFKEVVVNYAHIIRLYERVISTESDTLLTPAYWETAVGGGTAYTSVLAMWYDSTGAVELLQHKLYETDSSTDYRSDYLYGPLASATVIASATVNYSSVGSQSDATGVAFVPLATDGFGSLLAGMGVIDVHYGNVNSNATPTSVWEHYKDSPDYGGYSITATEIPIHVLMPSNGSVVSVATLPDARLPISPINSSQVGGMYLLPRPFFPKNTAVFAFSDAHDAGTLAQARFRIAFAVHPDRTKFIAGVGLVVADYWQLGNIPNDPLVPETSIKDAHYCAVGVQAAGSYALLPVETQWGGSYQFFNSPVFFRR